MVADSAKRNLVEVIHDIRRLEQAADEPNEIVRMTLREIVPLHELTSPAMLRAA